MERATGILKGIGAAVRAADVISLDYDQRHRRRMRMKAMGGVSFLLDLPDVPDLRGGDALVLEDGRLILVQAAPEPLMDIVCADARHFARLAWHLGNRHLSVEIRDGALRVRADHVIAEMARGLGATVSDVLAPFEPEKGAYHTAPSGATHHSHDHHHGPGGDHDH